ncbi:MAG: class I SAM-dependent methyltransferase [Candidatus Aminicenantes bacterium]|jgi:SAM-dependent methyltransferase
MKDLIKPEDMIKKLGVEGLCQSADEYFKNITDITPLMTKPFHDVAEGAYLLCKLGVLISGLRLGKGLTILDFGAGSCWLSRFLNELSCATISLDPSPTALEIGKKLFNQLPLLGKPIADPYFLQFDGRKIQLADDSVDRVICFDAFHHVPNPEEILSEFYRVLRPGGIAGFGEVGPHHSRSSQSQKEMRTYDVLENDVVLEHLKKVSREIGFSELYCKLFSFPDLEIDYTDYLRMARKKKIPKTIAKHITNSMNDFPVFFLIKGKYTPDSRNSAGLNHEIFIEKSNYTIKQGEPFSVTVEIENKGNARWLYQNIKDIGVVNLGVHLFSRDNRLINYDYLRFNLGKDVLPGERLKKTVQIKVEEKGSFQMVLDLVAEHVCWFEENNSQPVTLGVEVI